MGGNGTMTELKIAVAAQRSSGCIGPDFIDVLEKLDCNPLDANFFAIEAIAGTCFARRTNLESRDFVYESLWPSSLAACSAAATGGTTPTLQWPLQTRFGYGHTYAGSDGKGKRYERKCEWATSIVLSRPLCAVDTDDYEAGRTLTLDCGQGVAIVWEVDLDANKPVWVPLRISIRPKGIVAQRAIAHWTKCLATAKD
jgi:hypothetical protein